MARQRKTGEKDWGANTRISMPVSPSNPRMVSMGGFSFTTSGIAHDLSESEVEDLSIPPFSPDGEVF